MQSDLSNSSKQHDVKLQMDRELLVTKPIYYRQRILEAPDSLIVCCKRLTLFSFNSHAMILPFPFMREARWTVLLPGAEHASRTFNNTKY